LHGRPCPIAHNKREFRYTSDTLLRESGPLTSASPDKRQH